MDRRRLFYYILLNVFISACVTGTILYWYDRNLKATSSSVPSPQTQSFDFAQDKPEAAAAVPEANLSPNRDIPIEIVSVVGADNLGLEVVILRYLGEGQLDLTNWQLKDEDGNIFLFPSIIFFKDGAVQIHTASGTNTVVDLYWNMTAPVWKSGETAGLYDANGNLIVTYKVP
jgi:hypothetical protein